MTRLTGILSLALASFTSYSVFASPGPTQTLFTPIEATVEIGNGIGDGADGVDVGLELRLYFCIFIIYSDILIIFFRSVGPLVAVKPTLSSTGLPMTGLVETQKNGVRIISENAKQKSSTSVFTILKSPYGRMLEMISM